MAGRFRLRKISQDLHRSKPDEPLTIPGELGLKLGGQRLVEVPARLGFVYVRLRNDQSEVVQAYNDKVSPIYGLPVLVVRDRIDKGRYYIAGRDIGRYNNWGSSAYLPRHGAQHSFNPDAPGNDITWVWSRQFTPLLGVPSGSNASMNVLVYPGTLYYNNRWIYAGMTGTADLAAYKPTGANARMVLIYMDQHGNPQIQPGSYFDATLTGTQQIFPYIPSMPGNGLVPVAGVRLLSGSSYVSWDNLYDLRQFLHWGVFTGTAGAGGGGHTIQYNGSPLTSRSYLNFVGPNFYVFDDPVNGATVVSGSGGGGNGNIGTLNREIAFGSTGDTGITGTAYFRFRTNPTSGQPRPNLLLGGLGDALLYSAENSLNIIRQDRTQDAQIAIWNYNSGTTIAQENDSPPRVRFYAAKGSEPDPLSIVSGSVLGILDFRGYGQDDWYMGGMIRNVAIQPGLSSNMNTVLQLAAGLTGSLSFTTTSMSPNLEVYRDRILGYVPMAVTTGTNQGYYWGNIFTDGSWRSVIANERVEFQKLINGTWVTWGYSNTGSAGGGGYDTIQDDGVNQTQRTSLNFVGTNFAVYDAGGVTNVSGTAAGASATVALWEPRIIPGSPNSNDDEFNDSAIGAQWTEFDPANYVTVYEDNLGISFASNTDATGSAWGGVYMSITGVAYPWSATLGIFRIAHEGFAAVAFGFGIASDFATPSSNVQHIYGYSFTTGGNPSLNRFILSGTSGQGSSQSPVSNVGMNLAKFLRIRATSTTRFDFDVSGDGQSWMNFARNINPGFTPKQLGLYFYKTASVSTGEEGFAVADFLRWHSHSNYTGTVGALGNFAYS